MELETVLKPGDRVKLKCGENSEPYTVQMCLSAKLVVFKSVKQPLFITTDTGSITVIKASAAGLFVMEAKLKESSERGAVIALTDFQEPRFLERREHYRLNHDDISGSLDIELRPQNNANRYKRLKLHDISAGGIGLIVKSSSVFTQGMHVNLKMSFERKASIQAVAEVVHVTSVNALAKDFLVGFRYVQIDKVSHTMLMGFIQEQVILKNKGDVRRAAAEMEESLYAYAEN